MINFKLNSYLHFVVPEGQERALQYSKHIETCYFWSPEGHKNLDLINGVAV